MSTASEKAREALVKKLAERASATRTESPVTVEPEVVEPVVVAAPVPVTLLDGEVLYSELFGTVPPSGRDFGVKVYPDSAWDKDDIAFIPNKDKFKDFVVDHKVLEVLLRSLKHNLKALVVGPTGSGKTTLQEFMCAVVNQPYLRINGRQDMESDTLIGKPWVTEGEMTFILGELPKAMRQGWFVAFDEPWKTPAGIQMSLQRMYEKDGLLQLDDMPGSLADKQIVPKDTFRMVLCDNVVGTGDGALKYGATMIQDGSTLNRIDVVLKMNYLAAEDEVKMVQGMHPDLDKPVIINMVKLAHLLRAGFEKDELSAAVSPRNLSAWGLMIQELGDVKAAFDATIGTRFAEDSEVLTVQELYVTVFGR